MKISLIPVTLSAAELELIAAAARIGLKWSHVKGDHLEIVRRIYRGRIDSPKTHRLVRLLYPS